MRPTESNISHDLVGAVRSVFVDTSAWIGFFAMADEHHAEAVTAFEMLAEKDRPLVTSDYVVIETVTFLRRRHGHSLALRAWDALQEAAFVMEADKQHWEAAKVLFRKYDQLELSATDCVSFVLMKELGIRDALTFDADFERVGFRLVRGG